MNIICRNSFKIPKRFDFLILASDFSNQKPPWKVMFFGTDEFSLYSLKALHSEYSNGGIVDGLEVVTTVKGSPNPVYKFVRHHNLTLHKWPHAVQKNSHDVGLIVSFGHLIPQEVINAFEFGMLNVHASLLPRWRGAAPIIYALANGDSETGVTIMSIKPNHFDIGDIVKQEKVVIHEDMKMPELHATLGKLGAECLIKSLYNLPECLERASPQPQEGITYAPKVQQSFAEVQWATMTATQVYNLGRALEGYLPLTTCWKNIPVKLYDITKSENSQGIDSDVLSRPGFVLYNSKTKSVKVVCANRTCVNVKQFKLHGKRVISGSDFNNGYIKKERFETRCFES